LTMSEPVQFTDSSQQPTFSKKRGWKVAADVLPINDINYR